MRGSTPRKQLALDTNVVLDLAANADFAHEFKESFHRAGYALRLPPTAAGELHEQFLNGPTARKREQARVALANLLTWRILPLELTDTELAIAERFAERVLRKGLLPPEEFHDAVLLGEAALAGIPLLVTSDKHLLNADAEALALAFQDADLPPVQSAHPKALARALG